MKQAKLSVNDNKVLSIEGAITFYNAKNMCTELLAIMPDIPTITVELSRLEDCDSSVLVLLLTLIRETEKRQQTLRIRNIPKPMQVLIGLYDLHNLLKEGVVVHEQ